MIYITLNIEQKILRSTQRQSALDLNRSRKPHTQKVLKASTRNGPTRMQPAELKRAAPTAKQGRE